MKEENKVINGLWIGNKLSIIELLTIKSFLYHGHDFHLWVYDKIETPLPNGVIINDANTIIPAKDIIVRKYNDPVTGVGKGSVGAPFSDMFRYKLLYEQGGWWVDMDVTCLKPLDFDTPYFFRDHMSLDVIGNVIKCPKGSELMHNTYNEVKETCDENTLDWLLPNKILNKHIKELGLLKYVSKNASNLDLWPETKKYIRKSLPFPDEWYVIHWSNEEWRMNNIDKNHLRIKNSSLGDAIIKYEVPLGRIKKTKLLFNEIALARPFYIIGGIKKIVGTVFWYFYGHFKYWFLKFKKLVVEQK